MIINFRLFIVFILLAGIVMISQSCKNSNKTREAKNEETGDIPKPDFKVSANTKLFLNDLRSEINKENKKIEEFQPSEELIKKYYLQRREADINFTGFLTIEVNFDLNELKENDVIYRELYDKTYSVIVPIESISEFFSLDNIKYFEIAKKAKMKE